MASRKRAAAASSGECSASNPYVRDLVRRLEPHLGFPIRLHGSNVVGAVLGVSCVKRRASMLQFDIEYPRGSGRRWNSLASVLQPMSRDANQQGNGRRRRPSITALEYEQSNGTWLPLGLLFTSSVRRNMSAAAYKFLPSVAGAAATAAEVPTKPMQAQSRPFFFPQSDEEYYGVGTIDNISLGGPMALEDGGERKRAVGGSAKTEHRQQEESSGAEAAPPSDNQKALLPPPPPPSYRCGDIEVVDARNPALSRPIVYNVTTWQ